MPSDRPAQARIDDVVSDRGEVYGPACDSLIRSIAARLPPGRRGALEELLAASRRAPDGRPLDPDALFERLTAFDQSLRPPLGATLRRLLRALLAAVAGFLLGGIAIGIAAGVLTLLVGGLLGASQFEGAFAMGVATLMPVAGFWGGLVVGGWMAWRSWRRGGQPRTGN